MIIPDHASDDDWGTGRMIEHLEDWLWEIGEAAQRLCELSALEGSAGNISLFLPADTPGLTAHLTDQFSEEREVTLPGGSELPAGVVVITGAGRRLRDASTHPDAVLCAIVIAENGAATLHRAPGHGVLPTSEIDSHFGIHAAILASRPALHAVVHAQPPKLTWLSQIPSYREQARLNRQLLRWQPETIATLPEGIGILPFETPGTAEQGAATVEAMRRHQLLVWAKHGVVARSTRGPLAATDLIDYAEAAA
ncbi:MAG: class II aldolase/adducin family protein, partial [Vicinamibacterales bacterium]